MGKTAGTPKLEAAIGLDIGSYSVKCVEVAQEGEALKLQRVSILALPDSSPATLSALVKVMMNFPMAGKRLRVSVSGPSVLIRRISLPVMTPAEVKSAIRFEAEGHIPFPINDCILDCQILSHEPAKKTMNVLLVAAKRDFVMGRLKLLSDAGLQPDLIDVDIFCLANAFTLLGEAETDTYGILNIGHQVSSFVIMHAGLPYFVREIPTGGREVTRALAETKKLSEPLADKAKIERPASVSQKDLEAATQKGFESLAEEMKHSIDYFENEMSEELKTIWLSGGGALCAGAEHNLSDELGKNLKLWDNTKKMQVFGDIDQKFLKDRSSELNVALGMALRGARRK